MLNYSFKCLAHVEAVFFTRQHNNNPLQKVGTDACPVLIAVHFVMFSFPLTCIHSEGKMLNKMKLF